MIKGLSGFITWLCESQWSTHCIVSRKGPHVALQKSLLCHMSCLASHDISYMTWCICWIDLLYLIYDKCAWMIDISFAILFAYYVICHMISYIPTIYVYICLVFFIAYPCIVAHVVCACDDLEQHICGSRWTHWYFTRCLALSSSLPPKGVALLDECWTKRSTKCVMTDL